MLFTNLMSLVKRPVRWLVSPTKHIDLATEKTENHVMRNKWNCIFYWSHKDQIKIHERRSKNKKRAKNVIIKIDTMSTSAPTRHDIKPNTQMLLIWTESNGEQRGIQNRQKCWQIKKNFFEIKLTNENSIIISADVTNCFIAVCSICILIFPNTNRKTIRKINKYINIKSPHMQFVFVKRKPSGLFPVILRFFYLLQVDNEESYSCEQMIHKQIWFQKF